MGREHRRDVQLLPELIEHVDATVRPSVSDGDITRLREERSVIGEDAQDALGQPTQLLSVELIGAAEAVDDLGDSTAALAVPGVLGELVVADLGSVSVATLGGAQVHA